nr:TonB-dependent receptor [Chitinophagaceae bacterium]
GGILNGDIRYEIYPKGGEGITIGLFYKQFNDPIELRIDGQSVLTRRIYSYQNADEAYTIGGELEVRKNLSFIGNMWEHFDFFGNLTVSQSQVKLGGSNTIERPLQGQSPYLINAGFQYNNKDWNGSLLYNRIGQRLSLVGAYEIGVGGIPDIYERSRNLVDFQLAKKIMNNKGELKLTWSDILGESFYFYENIDSKRSFKDGTDRLFNAYKPGSTISIGFTYNFSLK